MAGAAGQAQDPVAELVDNLLASFNAAHRDEEVDVLDVVGRFWHPEGELVPRYAGKGDGSFHGREGVVRFLDASREQFRDFDVRFELEGLFGEGEVRASIYNVVARTKDSQIEVRQRMGAYLEVRDAKLFRLVVHADPADALRAAGLDPALARQT